MEEEIYIMLAHVRSDFFGQSKDTTISLCRLVRVFSAKLKDYP